MVRSPEEIRAELAEIRGEIGEHTAALSGLYDRRIEVWNEGRAAEPPMRHTDLGEASGVIDTAVINGLRTAREKAKKAG